MNSVSALFGKFNELSSQLTTQQHENQGKHVGRHQGQMDHQQGGQRSSQMSLYEVSLSFSSRSYSSHDNGVRILEQELEVRFSGARASQANTAFVPTFQPPSVDDVANNVLGFVESRIKQEAAGGASSERLDDLLNQAREGVEKGFEQAREQIESYGLMTEKLDNEIDQSFEKINVGLDELSQTYTSSPSPAADELEDVEQDADNGDIDDQSEQVVAAPTGNIRQQGDVQPSNNTAASNVQNELGQNKVGQNNGVNAGYSAFNSVAESAAIQITTRDGDVVSFNLEKIQASFEGGALSGDRYGFESSQLVGQYQSGQYSYSIDGELDEGEVQALNDLMMQIEEMSDQFFSGDFQAAFQSALELGFDGEEIAGFSVNLSQTTVQQMSAYQQVADMGSGAEVVDSSYAGRFDPLSEFFDSLQAAFDRASQFSQPAQLVSDLFDRVARDRVETLPQDEIETTPFEQMQAYMRALLERL
ncbi:DUF5610 domain-containing protein [Alkalimarinus sediminis]|uniref:DUF5610 domain-containing protein n=1 Tax=Alkalimarinus sediminis TaxID=1632866 RepID=A0A9E8HN09_9ALTE|nr:DUF5610 domain-containing protein [Alkalimarinus sediminis]UZW73271.1 DUF5610 domain-containing protein [Alkalimarinus sediminis]